MLRSLDLFSGIGGITLGLKGIVKPLAYCEIDPFCQQVLSSNMERGLLPKAPIIHDIRTFQRESINGGRHIDCITAGFPCQGFSSLGRREGFQQEQSSLFYEMLRVIDLFQPPILFLENVPTIVKMGMRDVDRELTARGYDLRWCIRSAADIGAPHVRRRWFCLGKKKNSPVIKSIELDDLFDWSPIKEPPRLSLQDGLVHQARCGSLGNAVVPDVVRAAFAHLLRVAPVPTGKSGYPLHGAIVNGKLHEIPEPLVIHKRDILLTFHGDYYRAQTRAPTNSLSSGLVEDVRTLKHWSTPRHGNVRSCNYLTERSLRDLPTQVRFERDTPEALRPGTLSGEFVEWLMGYPPGWTCHQCPR